MIKITYQGEVRGFPNDKLKAICSEVAGCDFGGLVLAATLIEFGEVYVLVNETDEDDTIHVTLSDDGETHRILAKILSQPV